MLKPNGSRSCRHAARPGGPLESFGFITDVATSASEQGDPDGNGGGKVTMPHNAISAPVAASSQPGRESPPPVQLAPVSHNLPTLARYELQVRILANQPAEEIAAAMNLPVGLVASFEATEFDVRPQLKHSSIVLHRVIGIPLTEEWSASDVGRFWQWLAYMYGAAVLDVAIPPYINLPPKLQELGLRAYLSPACDVCEDFRLLVAGKLTPTMATVTPDGRKLISKLQKATERRVRPVDLLTSLSGLICRPPALAVSRDEEPEPAPFYLRESA